MPGTVVIYEDIMINKVIQIDIILPINSLEISMEDKNNYITSYSLKIQERKSVL